MTFNRICIVGLGLIGGSLAKAIKKEFPECSISAIDHHGPSLHAALDERIIDKGPSDIADGVKDANLVFLCTPVHTMDSLIKEVSTLIGPNTIVTDVGSTKGNVMALAKESFTSEGSKGFFIGGHPMAGTQHSGYEASIPHLFENAYYILSPMESSPGWAMDSLKLLLSSIGALPLIMEPKEHDEIIGGVSHLPHVVAATLVNTVRDMDPSSHLWEKLAAGGFRDITRIASSNPQMWRTIALSNKDELLSLISRLEKQLNSFWNMLKDMDSCGIEDYFARAKIYRENLPVRQALNLLSYYDLYVDVEDRPGVIGEIATLLGKGSINIKNLRIINSREDEPGSLVISLPDAPSIDRAQMILHNNNYRTFIK
ncbi:MAG TPA: prephenate dehydrogenase [Clostridia bacterium]|nr:prephenate dehydrogenase [Clostridia bacterium]